MTTTFCQGTTAGGAHCVNRGLHQIDGFYFCGTHLRIHTRDNLSERLEPTNTLNSRCAIHILDSMRTAVGKEALDRMILELLVTRQVFNPADNVNKFIAGGVAEDVMTELISSLGFPTENVAAKSNVIDIRVTVEGNVMDVSLKNSGGIDQQPILENYRGDTRAAVRPLPPTFILYTETKCKRARIVYLDHDILLSAFPGLSDEEFLAKVYKRGDASLTFQSGLLRDLIPRLPQAYVVNATFPDVIPVVPAISITRLALEHIRKSMA